MKGHQSRFQNTRIAYVPFLVNFNVDISMTYQQRKQCVVVALTFFLISRPFYSSTVGKKNKSIQNRLLAFLVFNPKLSFWHCVNSHEDFN